MPIAILLLVSGNNPINQTDPTGEAGASLAFTIAKLVCTIKEFKRVRNELKSLPTPSSDISKSFRRTLRKNANTVKRTTKTQGIIESGKQFYYKVRNKGEWDLKQLPEYQGAFQLRDQMYIMYGIMLYREDQLLGGQE